MSTKDPQTRIRDGETQHLILERGLGHTPNGMLMIVLSVRKFDIWDMVRVESADSSSCHGVVASTIWLYHYRASQKFFSGTANLLIWMSDPLNPGFWAKMKARRIAGDSAPRRRFDGLRSFSLCPSAMLLVCDLPPPPHHDNTASVSNMPNRKRTMR